MKAEQILPIKLDPCTTKTIFLEQKTINLSKAVNSPCLSGDPNTGLRREQTVAAQLLRIVLAYAVVVAWVILN
ncbi:hypothetical protein MNBD_GAMMA16-173 [hydrothermal vent metagenome]|uniref:Uncharacterized protein n=1 Tax=hydrothermal vent metagenome TaxID=652676 RepID=A0A3B0ZKH1_9ZZZZ